MIFMAIILGIMVCASLVAMAYTGYKTPTNKTLIAGEPLVQETKLETGTDVYCGRLVGAGTNDDDSVVCTNVLQPRGFVSYEHTHPNYQPSTYSTAFAADDILGIKKGDIVVKGKLATPFILAKDQMVCNWTAGQLAGPVLPADGGVWLGIPFTNSAGSESDTGIDLPADMVVADIFVDVSTAVASSTIDVGLLSTESGGDADGFADGVSCASAVKVRPGVTVTSGSNEDYFSASTRGALLADFTAGTDAATDVGTYAEKPHRCDGTAKSISYTTSSHAVAGTIWLLLRHEGLRVVGQCEKAADASSAAVDIQVRCLI